MYTEVKTHYWKSRAFSSEYQKAYGEVARNVPKKARGVFLEAACGFGEILKRAYRRGSYQLLIGQDASSEMLDQAHANLAKAGIPVRIETDPQCIERDASGVVLVTDDLLRSHLPAGLADMTVFTFPDFGKKLVPHPVDWKLGDAFQAVAGTPPDLDTRIELRYKHALARLTAKNGTIIIADYGIDGSFPYNHANITAGATRMAEMTHMRLQETAFTENKGVWSDTIEAGQRSFGTAKKGYITFLMRKV
ncbi:MAG: class I SAM-dependent methyltransferase [Candidatus Woesearchaeota archaeon]|nr:class I SAM-dependent methyltransferase [Candidatus Woesearchaeota archaeon]